MLLPGAHGPPLRGGTDIPELYRTVSRATHQKSIILLAPRAIVEPIFGIKYRHRLDAPMIGFQDILSPVSHDSKMLRCSNCNTKGLKGAPLNLSSFRKTPWLQLSPSENFAIFVEQLGNSTFPKDFKTK